MTPKTEVTRRPEMEAARADEEYRVPPVDIYERDDGLVLLADMPGVGERDLEISIEEDTLLIRGTPRPERTEGIAPEYREFDPLPYRRVFTLSADVQRDAIEGKIRNGVLRLTLPKAERARSRKIPIKTE